MRVEKGWISKGLFLFIIGGKKRVRKAIKVEGFRLMEELVAVRFAALELNAV